VIGPPSLSSVSGTINALDGRFADPNLQVALQSINADVALSNGRANIDLRGQISSGGSVSVRGNLGLANAMAANLQIALSNVILEDPTLYRTQLNGDVSILGPLLSNARISGQIDVGETLISVPSSGVSSFGTIPNISHINAPSATTRTRLKAGLIKTESKSSSGGAAYPLNITVNAPQRIFVRGRGLDAELGGRLLLTGTTANIISAGRFELVRGRLDVLSERFELDEGVIQLQGDFDPFLRFVATTETTAGTASVIVEGSATDPQVRFESSPEAPQDEVLAQIFFGRDVSQISALQALQLASAVATLAGSGGEGIVSKLRRGFDLDDLDITTDDQGNAGLRAGKYISDNIYTDVTVGTQNNAEVSLNIDLTPSVTAKGKLGTNGDTSVGIYFEKDY
jgi:translocation and assembly module TamB